MARSSRTGGAGEWAELAKRVSDLDEHRRHRFHILWRSRCRGPDSAQQKKLDVAGSAEAGPVAVLRGLPLGGAMLEGGPKSETEGWLAQFIHNVGFLCPAACSHACAPRFV